ncbi:CoA ester lyase [Tsuneonella sp. CC-YZS046]|uniref:HpcH/HpaI aldolase/citrate lyase family protein n=1 Tax=Tsuneonella sp. CC-YZS046 TaxID=3042152 RepID=UPI002D7A1AA4|nr:CoA ester lyase [Tsuneonella sp. CC-YZS046]WRO65269.1 CoA ester lyase [Tsuneonella sp. CC-YZS046]
MLLRHARSLLFLPASNPRAIAKSRSLECDMVMLDLEDAVPDERKQDARAGAIEAAAEGGFGNRLLALRINTAETSWHGEDIAVARAIAADYLILPKVELPGQVADVAAATGKPVIAMIESPAGVFAAREIAGESGTAALFVGTNDLRRELGIPSGAGRSTISTALQTVVLAARAAGKAVFDGVYNKLDDPEGFEAECREGQALGFDGKTLIHPSQVEIANRVFGPDEEALAAARRLVEAATGGAERFEGEMIEAMHVEAAKALLERARHYGA